MARALSIPFIKGHGCLNTFLVIDLIHCSDYYSETLIHAIHTALLQSRCDSALIVLPSQNNTHSVSVCMEILEPDRSFSAFCGNGARVVTAYLEHLYGAGSYSLYASGNVYPAIAHNNGFYSINMGTTILNPSASKFIFDECQEFKNINDLLWSICFDELPNISWYFSQTGEPHLVSFDDITDDQLFTLGTILNTSYRSLFPCGINLNIVKKINSNTMSTRTYERGVNRITMACGTGSTSSAHLSYLLGHSNSPQIQIVTAGGNMVITYDAVHKNSIMYGPAQLELEKNELIIL